MQCTIKSMKRKIPVNYDDFDEQSDDNGNCEDDDDEDVLLSKNAQVSHNQGLTVKDIVDRGKGLPVGTEHHGNFHVYMGHKVLKLQDSLVYNEADVHSNRIFHNCFVKFNGNPEPYEEDGKLISPTLAELQHLILHYGGSIDNYEADRTTHWVSDTYTGAQLNQMHKPKSAPQLIHKKYKRVTSRWILDSVKEGKKLLESNYVPDGLNKYGKTLESMGFGAPQGSNQAKAALTTENPEFLKQYFAKSRLSYIGLYRSRIPDIVNEIKKQLHLPLSETSSSNDSRSSGENRVVMHVDLDCFFVNALIRDYTNDARSKPLAVAHSENAGSSEISCCNYPAREKGLYAGMYLQKAFSLCPELKVLDYDFDAYDEVGKTFYTVLFTSRALRVECVSVDEAYLEYPAGSDGVEIAASIRARIERETRGCTASIGVSHNKMLAKIATTKAKPNGIFLINNANKLELLQDLRLSDMPGVGYRNNEKLEAHKLRTVADITSKPLTYLQKIVDPALAKRLYDYCKGVDNEPVTEKYVQNSVGAAVNWGVRFTDFDNVVRFVHQLSEEVACRLAGLSKEGKQGKQVTLRVMFKKPGSNSPSKYLGHGHCDTHHVSSPRLAKSIYTSKDIGKEAIILLNKVMGEKGKSVEEIRGLGINMGVLSDVVADASMKVASHSSRSSAAYPLGPSHTDVAVRSPSKSTLLYHFGAPNTGGKGSKKINLQDFLSASQEQTLNALTPRSRRDVEAQLMEHYSNAQVEPATNKTESARASDAVRSNDAQHSPTLNKTSAHAGASRKKGFWAVESMVNVSRSLIVWIEHNQLTVPTQSNLELLKLYAIELANSWQFDVLVQFIRCVHSAVESVSYISRDVAVQWKILAEQLQDELLLHCAAEHGVNIRFD